MARRLLLALVTALVVAPLAVVGAVVTASPGAASENVTVAATASTLGPIPDGTGGASACGTAGTARDLKFTVAGVSSAISALSVSLTLTHPRSGDLTVTLIAPNGTTNQVLFGTLVGGSRACGNTAVLNGAYSFADTATANLQSAAGSLATPAVVPAGSYKAAVAGANGTTNASLNTAFAGLANPNGTWTLRVTDRAAGPTIQVGQPTPTVSAASLTVTTPGAASGIETDVDTGPLDGDVIGTGSPQWALTHDGLDFTHYTCSLQPGAGGTPLRGNDPCTPPWPTGPAVTLADGAYLFTATSVDSRGNAGPPLVVHFTVDTVAPETTITGGPAEGARTTTSPAPFTFTTTDPHPLRFECWVDAGAPANCASGGVLQGLAAGPHVFSVRAVDAAGNVDATPATRTFVVDASPPDTRITTGPADGSRLPPGSTPLFAFASTDADLARLECSLDGAAYTTCTSPAAYVGLSGRHAFAFRAVDTAGNVDPTPATCTLRIDTVACAKAEKALDKAQKKLKRITKTGSAAQVKRAKAKVAKAKKAAKIACAG